MSQFLQVHKFTSDGYDCRISPVDQDSAALLVTRGDEGVGKPSVAWIAYFDRDAVDGWTPRQKDGVGFAYDVKRAGEFVELDTVPRPVAAALPQARKLLTDNDRLYVRLGKERGPRDFEVEMRAIEASIVGSRVNFERTRIAMAEYGRRHVPGFDIDAFQISDVPHRRFTDIIDLENGPIILTITGAESFSLATPANTLLLGNDGMPFRLRIEVQGAKVDYLPRSDEELTSKLQALVDRIRIDYRPKFQEAALGHISDVLREDAFQSAVVDRYEKQLEEWRRTELAIQATSAVDTSAAPGI